MTRHDEAAAERTGRFVLIGLALAIAAMFFAASRATTGRVTAANGAGESVRCLVCGAPHGNTPPKHHPSLPVHANPDLASEVEIELENELENETDSAWPGFVHDRANGDASVPVLSRGDRADNPCFFVDAADLSRFCKLTL